MTIRAIRSGGGGALRRGLGTGGSANDHLHRRARRSPPRGTKATARSSDGELAGPLERGPLGVADVVQSRDQLGRR